MSKKKEEQPEVPAELVPYYCLLDAKRVPMDEPLSRAMIQIAFATEEDLGKVREGLIKPDSGSPLAARILESRLAPGVTVTNKAWMWILSQTSTPGDAVMWAYTLSVISWLQEDAPVTDDLIMMDDRLFGLGVPDMDTDDVLRIWDAQKYHDRPPHTMDNYLDHPWFIEAQKKELWGKGLDVIPTVQTGARALEEVT